MKKTCAIVFIFIFFPLVAESGMHFLTLRASHHTDFLRIVIEGDESVISDSSVYQKGENVIVTFPSSDLSIQSEQIIVPFRRTSFDTVTLLPGDFRGLKVFKLKHPDRLVIDVYQKNRTGRFSNRRSFQRQDKREGSIDKQKIVIDPGHGGYDFGISNDSYSEKNTVLDIAKKLRLLINKGYAEAFLTRSSDLFMTMKEREKYVHDKEGDIFISIHVGKHKEIVLYVPVVTEPDSDMASSFKNNQGQKEYLKDSVALLNAMKDAFKSEFGDDMVIIKYLPYNIISKVEAAAVLIELPSFQDAYYIEELRNELSNTIYKGLYIYEENRTS